MSDATPASTERERFLRPEWQRERTRLAYIGVALAIAQALFLVVVRLISTIWTFEDDIEPLSDWIRALALAMSLGIIPAVATIFIGWEAMVEAKKDRTRVLAAISLGSGALFVVLWVSRLVDAVIAGSLGDEFGGFIFGPFWWA